MLSSWSQLYEVVTRAVLFSLHLPNCCSMIVVSCCSPLLVVQRKILRSLSSLRPSAAPLSRASWRSPKPWERQVIKMGSVCSLKYPNFTLYISRRMPFTTALERRGRKICCNFLSPILLPLGPGTIVVHLRRVHCKYLACIQTESKRSFDLEGAAVSFSQLIRPSTNVETLNDERCVGLSIISQLLVLMKA